MAELQALLDRSFAILRAERPAAAADLGRALARCPVWIEGEIGPFGICSGEGGPQTTATAFAPAVRLGARRATVQALLTGTLTLEAAIAADHLQLWGSIAALDAALALLSRYVQLAVRSPAQGRLCDEFLSPTLPQCGAPHAVDPP